MADAPPPHERLRTWFLDVTDLLLVSLRQFEEQASRATHAELERTFAVARDRYKRIEAIAEFSFPGTAKAINGPPLEHTEDDNPSTIIQPEGFQLLEELLSEPTLDTARLRLESAILAADITRLRKMASTLSFSAPLAFAAARQEIARISVRGVVSADSPIARRGPVESVAALEGVVSLLEPFTTSTQRRRFEDVVSRATVRLRNASPDDLDYARLFSAELRGASHALDSLRRTLGVPLDSSATSLWRAHAPSLFDSAAFSSSAFGPRENRVAPATRVDLGRSLFFDTILSGDASRSCASCHDPRHAFADVRPASPAVGGGTLARNAPSLVNAALQPALFHDMRTAFVEDQAIQVIESPVEMNGRIDTVIARLVARPDYRTRFTAAFSGSSSIDRDKIALAIGAYVRSLIGLDSPVDRYLRGDSSTLSVAGRRGLNVFAGKGRCAMCHFLPLTSGAVPPDFAEMEAEGLGVPSRHAGVLDRDAGLVARTRFAPDSFHFRTPSLRNVGLTAPYMHNGAFRTLSEVIDFYNGGGGAGLGFDMQHQTLPSDSLHLTTRERADLLAFLESLTDTSYAQRR